MDTLTEEEREQLNALLLKVKTGKRVKATPSLTADAPVAPEDSVASSSSDTVQTPSKPPLAPGKENETFEVLAAGGHGTPTSSPKSTPEKDSAKASEAPKVSAKRSGKSTEKKAATSTATSVEKSSRKNTAKIPSKSYGSAPLRKNKGEDEKPKKKKKHKSSHDSESSDESAEDTDTASTDDSEEEVIEGGHHLPSGGCT